MPIPAVIERVRELDAELGETQPDPRAAPAVEDLKRAVAAVLLQPDHMPHYTTLSDKLLFAYVGFELDHPKLAAAIQGVKASLIAAGI